MVDDEPTASFALSRVILESVQTKSSRDTLRPVRAVVEIVRHHGGLMPRALLGGTFTPSEDEADLLIEVQTSDGHSTGKPSCKSHLWTPLIPGLPDEFAQSVVDGFIRRPLPAGRIVVDRAAFDPVGRVITFGVRTGCRAPGDRAPFQLYGTRGGTVSASRD